MTVLVIDSSVAVKWFLTEAHSAEALHLLKRESYLHAPSLLMLEFDGTLTKRIRAGLLTPSIAREIRGAMKQLPVQFHDFVPLLEQAFELAIETRQTVYDCLFLALAVHLGSRMVTADRRFHDGILTGPLRDYLLWIGDVPAA